MVNIPDYKKILNKDIKFNQKEYYEDNFEKTKVFAQEVDASLSAIANQTETIAGTTPSALNSYPNLMKSLFGKDLTGLKIIGMGDSHTAGQGEEETGGKSAPQLAPPVGVTDEFHRKNTTPSLSSGKFFDKFARAMADRYGLGIVRRLASVGEQTYYHTYTGTWTKNATDTRMPENGKISISITAGSYVVKKMDPTKPQRCVSLRFAKLAAAGRFEIFFRANNATGKTGLQRNAEWLKPSQISGIVRSDGLKGTDMDIIDLYAPVTNYAFILGYTFPYLANWEIKLVVSAVKNASSTGFFCTIGPTIVEHENFINAGRGNHTTLDYLGNTVTIGAGGAGDFDHTDHLQEVLNLNPTLILLQPMTINNWFHGESLQDTETDLLQMIKRIKLKGNCDILCITPAPVITDYTPFDYAENPNFATAPPLTNNLNGFGTYEQYIGVIEKVCKLEQVTLINMYEYFVQRYAMPSHINWTLGATAGRIHLNQAGHNVYYDGIIENSSLF